MTIAFQDIEDRLTPVDPTERAPARVLIVARTEAFGAAIGAMMDLDDSVAGDTVQGTLREVVQDTGRAWNGIDFLVFEGRPEDAAEREALRHFLASPGPRPVCLAMIAGPITEDQKAAYLDAGVHEVLRAKAPQAPRTQRLHLADSMLEGTSPEPDAPEVTEPAAQQGALTLVLRSRGGAGASTLAVNLAVAELAHGSAVLLDLDLQGGSVASLLDLADSAEFTSLVKAQQLPNDAFIDRALIAHSSGLRVIPAPDTFAPMTALTPAMVDRLLTLLRARFDHVIVDLPQAVMDWFEPVLAHASRAILVTDTTVPSIKRTRRLIDVLTEDHMTLPVSVVVNGEKRPLFATPAHKEAARLLERPLDHWIPPDARAMRTARDLGVPVLAGARRSAPARAYRALADALHKSSKKAES